MYRARCSGCQLRHQNKLCGHGKLRIHSLQNGESKEEALESKLDAKECLDQELVLVLDDDERKQWSSACIESFCQPLVLASKTGNHTLSRFKTIGTFSGKKVRMAAQIRVGGGGVYRESVGAEFRPVQQPNRLRVTTAAWEICLTPVQVQMACLVVRRACQLI
uniref:Uncharacterized protein n=1 Tax=Oryza sativa subsp. indica TaxID=39946 RepID=A0A679B8W5_ORYSI|nr:hypothetical protein [Oryza sativa Indica Group]